MNHYYFKFWKGNKGLEKWLEVQGKKIDEMVEGKEQVQLSIYYDDKDPKTGKGSGLSWKVKQMEGVKQMQDAIDYFGNKSKQAKQIELFFNLKNEPGDSYFWIFNDDLIYVFKGNDLEVFDGPDGMIDDKKSSPKSISVIYLKKFEKKKLPGFFSSINSNQKYNRGTIAELENSEKMFAELLISDKPKSEPVDRNNFHEYLSPVEFETLIFLIFNQNGNYCSSFRGGTLKKYDLRIIINNPIYRIPKKSYWVQIKKKDEEVTLPEGFEDYIVIYTGESKNDKILGIDWIRSIVENNESIINWLTHATFGEADEKYINFKW